MIDLFSVKLNNNYDEIGAIPTIENGTFLCDTTSENYIKGYSYQITNGNAERIEQTQDYKIKNAIYPTIQNVCEWLNNWFTIKYDYAERYGLGYSGSGGWHEVAQFPSTGDLCKIRTTDDWDYVSLYNIFFVSYVTVNGETVTSDNPEFNPDEAYFYYIMHLPQDVESAISSMLFYDFFTRGTVDGLKSESVGNYSYTKDDVTIGTLAYPKALISGLEANYRKLRFVQ